MSSTSAAPGTRTEPSPGVFVYDIGQNLTGWAAIRVQRAGGHGDRGLLLGEARRRRAGPARPATTSSSASCRPTTTSRRARATSAGRRASLQGLPVRAAQRPARRAAAGGRQRVASSASSRCARGSRRPGRFESSSETLNRIHRNTAWAMQSNMHGIITDTPVYEKNAWTGDAQLTAGTASLLFDTERLYQKMFQDMRDAQTAEGELSLLAPSNRNYGYVGKPAFKPEACCGATPAWDAFWFVLPWESYRRHGDRDALAASLPRDAEVPRRVDPALDRTRTATPTATRSPPGSATGFRPRACRRSTRWCRRAYYARFARIAADVARVARQGGRRRALREAVRRHQERLQRALPRQGRRLPREGSRPVRRDRADPPARVRARAGRAARRRSRRGWPTTS